MTGWWAVSYVALWLLVLLIATLEVGVLYELGRGRTPRPGRRTPRLEEDGPGLGSSLPVLSLETVNGYGRVDLAHHPAGVQTLLMFLSPLCEGCQDVIDPINEVVSSRSSTLRVVVVLRGDEYTCRSFLNIFPLHVPVVRDPDGALMARLSFHHHPGGLLYNEHGPLVRVGAPTAMDELLALLGDGAAQDSALGSVFPRTQSADLPVGVAPTPSK